MRIGKVWSSTAGVSCYRILPGILIGMARPLRLEFPGAIYHLTARGDRREDIFSDNADRELLLQVFAACVARFGCVTHTA